MKKQRKLKNKTPKNPNPFKAKAIVTSRASRGFNVGKKKPPKVNLFRQY